MSGREKKSEQENKQQRQINEQKSGCTCKVVVVVFFAVLVADTVEHYAVIFFV